MNRQLQENPFINVESNPVRPSPTESNWVQLSPTQSNQPSRWASQRSPTAKHHSPA